MAEVEIRNIIVNAATQFFSKFGFSKTTMSEIAKHTHKAKGLLYYYFNSKEELFNEVLKQELGKVKTGLGKIAVSDADPLIMLRSYLLLHLKLLNNALTYHETLKADFFEKYHFVKNVRDDFNHFEREQLSIILGKGKGKGYLDITDITSSANIILMVLHGIELSLFLQDKYAEYEFTLDELSTVLISGLKFQKK
ncbi:MAG: helix-turn-helix domain-containing protein [Prolixibacteraceae bacterium]